MQEKGIAILDFGSQYTQTIARRIRYLNVFSEIFAINNIPAKISSIFLANNFSSKLKFMHLSNIWFLSYYSLDYSRFTRSRNTTLIRLKSYFTS